MEYFGASKVAKIAILHFETPIYEKLNFGYSAEIER